MRAAPPRSRLLVAAGLLALADPAYAAEDGVALDPAAAPEPPSAEAAAPPEEAPPEEAPPEEAPPAARAVPEVAAARAAFGTLALSSDPIGAEVRLDGGPGCTTPCRLTVPPGPHALVFAHPDRTEIEATAVASTDETVRVHVVLGRETPHQVVAPLYFVATIFTAGGISSVVLNHDTRPKEIDASDGDADSRRFHRNLGIASVAVGVPLIGLATWLAARGAPGEVAVSAGPAGDGAPRETSDDGPKLGLAPTVDAAGAVAGASLTGTF